jgi:hypothetical protein
MLSAAQSFKVAFGVDASLSTCSNVFDRGAQAGAATRRCQVLLQHDKDSR